MWILRGESTIASHLFEIITEGIPTPSVVDPDSWNPDPAFVQVNPDPDPDPGFFMAKS